MKKDKFHQPLPAPVVEDRLSGGAVVREVAVSGGDSVPGSPEASMSVRFVDARLDVSYPGEPVQSHCHPFHEMIYCINGGGEYQLGGERLHLNRGDILSVPAGVVHIFALQEAPAEPFRRYVLRLSPEFSQVIHSIFLTESVDISSTPFILPTAGTAWEPLSEYFRRCVQECEQKQLRWDASVFGIATELSVQIARAWHGNRDNTQAKPELLDRIMGHVETHLSEKITLQDVAARFWVSQSTISQLFRKKMGVSFYRYVTMRRLSEAQLLIQSGLPMDQVGISVGFSDYSTFYRAFRAEYGISPAQYRKNHTPG